QSAKVAGETRIEVRCLVLGMNALPKRQMMRYDDRSAHEIVGKVGSQPPDAFHVNRPRVLRAKRAVPMTYELEVIHSVPSNSHSTTDRPRIRSVKSEIRP